jgi:hypothetical protein
MPAINPGEVWMTDFANFFNRVGRLQEEREGQCMLGRGRDCVRRAGASQPFSKCQWLELAAVNHFVPLRFGVSIHGIVEAADELAGHLPLMPFDLPAGRQVKLMILISAPHLGQLNGSSS